MAANNRFFRTARIVALDFRASIGQMPNELVALVDVFVLDVSKKMFTVETNACFMMLRRRAPLVCPKAASDRKQHIDHYRPAQDCICCKTC